MFETVISALNEGFVKTFEIVVATLIGALPLGLLLAFGTISKFKPLKAVTRAIVWVVRGTPLMLQLLVVYHGRRNDNGQQYLGSRRFRQKHSRIHRIYN